MRVSRIPFSILAAAALALPVVVIAAPVAGAATVAGGADHLGRMLLYAAIALVFSFLCSVAEAVVLSVNPSFIAHLEQQGRPLAGRLQALKSNIDRTLAAILTLNTIAHTLGAGGAGAEAAAYFGDRYVGVSMAVLTLLILFVSEIVPKTLGALYWRSLAAPTTVFVRILIVVLYPFIWFSEILTRLMTRGQAKHGFSRAEFAALADLGLARGLIAAGESRVLKNLFRLPELRAEDVMTPRTVVLALPESMTLDAVVREYPDLRFSRIPVYRENQDDVTGFVLKTEILLGALRGRGAAPLSELRREIFAVPETASLAQVSEQLLERRQHLALVIDEYGGLAGVVTLEDVVETLMGIEIVDEVDQIDDLRRLARERWSRRRAELGIDPP